MTVHFNLEVVDVASFSLGSTTSKLNFHVEELDQALRGICSSSSQLKEEEIVEKMRVSSSSSFQLLLKEEKMRFF
jgi:hypothetical protein